MKIEDYPDNYDCMVNIVQKDDKVFDKYFSSWKDFNVRRVEFLKENYKNKNWLLNSVQWHKDVLGKQTSTFIIWGQRRYCWDFEGWCVIVHNVKGTSIELDREKTSQQAFEIWEHYKKIMLSSLKDKSEIKF